MFGKYRISSTPTTPATPTPNGTPSSSNYFLSPLYNTTLKPTPSTKRKRTDLEMNKENILLTPEPPAKKPYTRRRSPKEKLEVIFHALSTVNWTMSDFLHYTFRTKEEDGSKIHRTDRHSKYAQHFLQGTGKYTPTMILDCWFRNSDGRISETSDRDLMYSTSTLYIEIRNVRAGITSFAVQIVREKLVAEAKQAVKPTSGLQASGKKKKGHLKWSDIDAATVAKVAEIIENHRPLTWHYMMSIAQPESRGGHNCR